MMRSLSSAVSGLRAHQTKMDVIGNNIANVNTYGFKSSRVTFTDVYYQTLSSGNAPTASMGGTNPTQIGYGAKVATVDVMNSISSAAQTDRAMDIYISGDGMVAVQDTSGNLRYTRMGVLGFDALGRLVDMNGNFVMGFPMGNNGPIVNPDGSVDIDDLTRIEVDTEILDELTGISISTSGEILGTMAGDTEITANKNRPAWLVDVSIDPESHITGNIHMVMAAVSQLQGSSSTDWITEISAPNNSMVEGDYNFYYDEPSGRITAVSQNDGTTFTGTYVRGSTIELTDAAGNTGFVITTHNYTTPVDGGGVTGTAFDRLSFNMSYQVTLSGTDKGGNKYEQTQEFNVNSPPSSLRFGDLDVTLTIDASKMEPKEMTLFSFDFQRVTADNTNFGWLLGASIDADSALAAGDVQLQIGYEYSPSLNQSTWNHLKFMDSTMVQQMLKDLGATGTISISAAKGANGGTVYNIYDSNSNTTPIASSNEIMANGENIIFTGAVSGSWNVGTYNQADVTFDWTVFTSSTSPAADLTLNTSGSGYADALKAVQDYLSNYADYSAAPTVYGAGPFAVVPTGADEFEIRDENGSAVLYGDISTGYMVITDTHQGANATFNETIAQVTGGSITAAGASFGNFASKDINSNISTSTATLATVNKVNKIYLLDANSTQIDEVTYTNQNSITIGDITLQIDREALVDYFNGSDVVNIGAGGATLVFGTVYRDDNVIDWSYDRDAASASTGIGETFVIGQIAIATVRNMAGMTQEGDGYFTTNFNSGEANFWIPGLGGSGELSAGYLEQSNVDISQEFTDMITTQRGFQANTRIITVSDEMLQELVNLKR